MAMNGLPHQGHPSEKYSLKWEIEQAGSGWLSIGSYHGFSITLIKQVEIDRTETIFPKLQHAFHENLVGLVEAFYDNTNIYLAYNYHNFAVHLSQVISTPTTKLNEPEVASICKSVLKGLQYIHEELQIVHGNIDSHNIILCPDGVIKIANIGSSMIRNSQKSLQTDLEDVGSLLTHCLGHKLLEGASQPIYHEQYMSIYARHFLEHVGMAKFSFLFEHTFLQQASPDGRAWYLIPHYLDTMIYWKGIS